MIRVGSAGDLWYNTDGESAANFRIMSHAGP